jgi:hypothetical protein
LATTTVNGTNLQTLINGSNSDSLHAHNLYEGVGASTTVKKYWNFSLPFVLSTNVPSGDFWTKANLDNNTNLNIFQFEPSSDATTLLYVTRIWRVGANGLAFDDGKDLINEVGMSFRADASPTEQHGWGFVSSTAPLYDYDSTVASVNWAVDSSRNLYAHTANGTTGTLVPITGIDLTNLNTYRIEYYPSVGANFFVNGTLEATLTTTTPDSNVGVIMYGFGQDGENTSDKIENITTPYFAVEK